MNFFMRALVHCSFVRSFTGDDTTNAGEDLIFTIACSFLNIAPCESLYVNGEFMIPFIDEDEAKSWQFHVVFEYANRLCVFSCYGTLTQ